MAMISRAVFDFRGESYPLMMDLYALEKIEEEFGGMRAVREEMVGGKQFTTIGKLFRILGNAALEADEQPETLTGKEIRRATLEEVGRLMGLILRLIDMGNQTTTNAGEAASDERKEIYQDEDDLKN